MKTDNSENNVEVEDEYVKELQKSIRSVKQDRKLERGFMTWNDIRTEARDEGRLEGKKEDILELLKEMGEVPEDIKSHIMSETKENSLKTMLKATAGIISFAEYREKILNV